MINATGERTASLRGLESRWRRGFSLQFEIDWSRQASMNKDLKEVRKGAKWIAEGRVCQGERKHMHRV